MMGAANPQELLWRLMQADEFGVKLEIVEGSYTWEFFPSPLHQGVVHDIERSIRAVDDASGQRRSTEGCGCYSLADAYIQFADGSFKRPDISIFCTKPILTQQALKVIPEAVVEVISPGSEEKDLRVGPKFYLGHGVKDVVVVDPQTQEVRHFRQGSSKRLKGPVTIRLECGCELQA